MAITSVRQAGLTGFTKYRSLADASGNPEMPFPSWTFNEETCDWDPPIPFPAPLHLCIWNEAEQSWSVIGE